MRFRLVEDKSITLSDKDYEIVKKFIDEKDIKYQTKDKYWFNSADDSNGGNFNNFKASLAKESERQANRFIDENRDILANMSEDKLKKFIAKYERKHGVKINRDTFKVEPKDSKFGVNLDANIKKWFIGKFNNSLANSINGDNLDTVYDVVANYNADDAFKSILNDYGDKFVDKPESLKTVAQLTSGSKLSEKSIGFIMSDKNFFNDSDDNIAFKLKAIALLDDPSAKEKWVGENASGDKSYISYVQLTKSGSKPTQGNITYLSRADMEKKLRAMQDRHDNKVNNDEKRERDAKAQEKEKELETNKGPTGAKILASKFKDDGKELNMQSFRDYAKTLVPTNDKQVAQSMAKIIDNGDINIELRDLAETRYKSSLSEDPIDILNDKIKELLNKTMKKIAKDGE